MTLEEKVSQLEKQLNDLKGLFYKDNFSNLQIFRKNVEFKGNAEMSALTLTNLVDLVKTGGTDVIADGNHTKSIPAGGGTITITTKNGVITAIT